MLTHMPGRMIAQHFPDSQFLTFRLDQKTCYVFLNPCMDVQKRAQSRGP